MIHRIEALRIRTSFQHLKGFHRCCGRQLLPVGVQNETQACDPQAMPFLLLAPMNVLIYQYALHAEYDMGVTYTPLLPAA